jgi:hypothetical protein
VAEAGSRPPSEETVNLAYQVLRGHVDQVETLIGYEGDAFATTGDVIDDLLSITSVHPMREEAVIRLLEKGGRDRDTLMQLVRNGELRELEYAGRSFYMRALRLTPPD